MPMQSMYWNGTSLEGSKDPSKVPLAGGTVTGNLYIQVTGVDHLVLHQGYACYPVISQLSDTAGQLYYKGTIVGVGDMTKAVYDTNADGTVNSADNADTVDNLHAADFVRYYGTTKTAGGFYGGTTAPSNVNRLNFDGYLYATRVYGAAYNDIAEMRKAECRLIPGTVAIESEDGIVLQCKRRLSKIPMVVSDTYGFLIGPQNKEDEAYVPIAIAGRALVRTDKNRHEFKVGDAVCSGINGTASKMKWWEKILFPERILGYVSEVPRYEEWGTENVSTAGRIWIKVT